MDNIKVAIRVRPLIGRESGMVNHWTVQDDTIKPTEAVGKLGTSYTFDRIFDELMTTYDIFEEVCKPIIAGAVQGFNGTVFAYGQSSSGKTFTMSGGAMQKGIISLAVEEIFATIEASHHREFLIRVAYMEIYNEKVTDLLSTEETTIKIQEDQEKNIQVTGVKEELVSSHNDVLAIIQKGDNRRHMAETKQNDRSSRSHCIIRIIIESREKGDEEAVMVAHLNFVDLAGSEKAGENTGDRLREGCSINKSLLILGQVISKLSDGVSNQHISYRDSKLTRILQVSLGGNSKTAIIATITPASLEESHSTLRFASQAKKITNKAKVNEVLSDAAMLKKYQKEIHHQQQVNELGKIENQDLKKSLEQMEAKINNLKKFIIQSGPTQGPVKRKRRETWCPGKNKRMSIFRPSTSLADEDIFMTEMPPMEDFPDDDVHKAPANVTTRQRSIDKVKFPERKSTAKSPDAKIKQMMELEDKYEALLKEHNRLKTEYNDMSTFHNLERETLEENIVALHQEKEVIHSECMKLTDEVVQTEYKLSIQTRRMTDCQNELESYRTSLSKEDSSQDTPDTDMLTLQQECDKLKETVRQLEEEKESSKTDSQESENTLQKIQGECTVLKLQVEKLEEERIELMKKLDIENNKIFSSADEQLSMREESTDVGYNLEQVPVLQDKCEKLEEEKNSLLMELDLLKKEGNVTPEIQEEELQNLQETADNLQRKLQQAEEEKMLLVSEVESLQNEHQKILVDNEIATMAEECKMLREKVKQYEEEKLASKIEEANSKADSGEALQKLQEECSILRLQIEELESEKVKQAGGFDTENDRIAVLEEECEVLRATVKDLADERLNMQDKLTDVCQKVEQLPVLEGKCDELMQEKELLLTEISSLKEKGNTGPEMQEIELQILREKTSNLQTQLETAEEERIEMALKLENLQNECPEKLMDNERAKLEEECEVLRATVKDLGDERVKIEDDLRDVGLKIEHLPLLKGKYEELVQEKESLLTEISSLKEESKTGVEMQESELQNLREKARDLEEKLEQAEEKEAALISKLENVHSEDHNSVSQMEEECERLRETIKHLEEEKLSSNIEEADTNQVIEKLQEECSDLKLQIETLESERTKSEDTSCNKTASQEEEYEILRITVKDLIDERQDMQDELNEAEQKIKQMPILKEKCEELAQKNKLLLSEVSLLKEGKPETEMQDVELQILRERANSLQEELKSAKGENQDLISRMETMQSELEKRNTDNAMTALEEECEILRATAKDFAEERLNMQDELKEVSHKMEELPILKEKCEKLVQENESLLTEISSLKAENPVSEMQVVELQILREKASKLQEQLESAEEEKDSLISNVENLQNESPGMPIEECERLRETIRLLEEENASSKTKDADYNDVIQKLQEECSALKLQVEKLESDKSEAGEGTENEESHRIATLEGECEVLRATVKELADECLGMQEKLACAEELPILKENYEELAKEKAALLSEMSSLEEEGKAELEIKELELQNLKDKASNLQEQLELVEEEKANLISRLENVKTDSQEQPLNSVVAVMEEECERLRETVKKLEEQKMTPETGAADSSECVQKLQEECSVLKLQIEKLESERFHSIEGTESERVKMAALEEECEVLRATLKESDDERLNVQDKLTDAALKVEQLSVLQGKCEELEQTKNLFAAEISQLKQTNLSVEVEKAEMAKNVSSLQQQLEEMLEEKVHLKSCLEVVEKDSEEKQIEISQLKQTNLSVEVEKAEMAKNISSLQQQLEEMLEEKVNLKSCLEVVEKDSEEKQIAEKECEFLQGKMKDLSDECISMQNKITDLELKAEQLPILKEKCEELVQEKDLLLQEVSLLRKETTEMKSKSVEVRNMEENVSSLQLQLEQSKQETLYLNSQVKQLETERHEKSVEIEKFKHYNESLSLEKKYLDEKVENLGKELAERISQQNAESGRVCVLLEEMGEMQENIARAEKERNEMELKLEKSISELHVKNRMNEELLQYQAEVTQLHEEKSQLSNELDMLKQRLSSYDTPESMQAHIEQLKLQVANLSSANIPSTEHESTICAKDDEIDQLKLEITALKDQISVDVSHQGSSTSWDEEKTELLKKISDLKTDKAKLFRLMSEVNQLKKDKKTLASYSVDLEKQLENGVDESDIGKKLKAAEADVDKYYHLHDQQQRKIEELQTEFSNVKGQLLTAQKKMAEMQQTLKKHWEEIGEKKMEIYSQNQTIEEYEAKKQKLVQQYEETIEMKDNRIKKLQVEIRRRDAETSFMEPSSKVVKGDNSTSKENVPGGVVDQYNAFMLEAKNLRLEKEVTRLNKKLKTLEDNPVVKPCSCPFKELTAKFKQQSEEKRLLQKEFDELKKKHIFKIGGQEIDTSELNVPDVRVSTSNPGPTSLSRHNNELLSESKRKSTSTSYSRKPFSDNECKQQ